MNGAALGALFLHFLSLSVFATGGAMALATDMHRYVVDEHHYIDHAQFVNSIALAQASPGPNILFVTVMGWQIAGFVGALATTAGICAPALVFPFLVSRLGRLAQFERVLKSLQVGLGPVALGLMASTSLLLVREAPGGWKGWTLIAICAALSSAKRTPPLLLIGTAGVIGAFVNW